MWVSLQEVTARTEQSRHEKGLMSASLNCGGIQGAAKSTHVRAVAKKSTEQELTMEFAWTMSVSVVTFVKLPF